MKNKRATLQKWIKTDVENNPTRILLSKNHHIQTKSETTERLYKPISLII